MGQFREITRTVTLDATGGANDTLRCWDAPTGSPLRQLSIILSTRGLVTAAADLDWDVIYGGIWAGTPYDTDSTHTLGVSQSSGTIVGAVEIIHTVYNTTNLIPINSRSAPQTGAGFPVVVELTNKKAVALTVYVTFLSHTVNSNV